MHRFWKSVKCEEVYLHAYETASVAQQGLERYVTFYSHKKTAYGA